MVPPKSWHSQAFHPISKSQQPLWRVSKSRLCCIYFSVRSCMFWSRSWIRKQGSHCLAASLGFFHLSPLYYGVSFYKSWLFARNLTIKVENTLQPSKKYKEINKIDAYKNNNLYIKSNLTAASLLSCSNVSCFFTWHWKYTA